jgi:hypothetical protein
MNFACITQKYTKFANSTGLKLTMGAFSLSKPVKFPCGRGIEELN